MKRIAHGLRAGMFFLFCAASFAQMASATVSWSWSNSFNLTTAVEHNHNVLHAGDLIVAPNPFNPAVTIIVNGNGAETLRATSLRVYNTNGRMVADLTSGVINNRVTWDAGTHPAGVYVVRAMTGGNILTKRITLLR